MPAAPKRRRTRSAVPASQQRARAEYVKTSGVVITDEDVAAVIAEQEAALARMHARLRRARRARTA
jgi:hypothetical protein